MHTLCYFCASSRFSAAVYLLERKGRNRDLKTNQEATRLCKLWNCSPALFLIEGLFVIEINHENVAPPLFLKKSAVIRDVFS